MNSIPREGDSIVYHIPAAKNIVNGNFITQKNVSKTAVSLWYPEASEAILGLFILFKIPLNLFNVLAIFIFFVVLYKLGRLLLKDKNISIIYACSIVNSYGVLRLSHTQNIDIWLAIYFLLLILFLEKPKNKNSYFLLLGIFSGFLIGTKYTGPLYFLILSVFYFKNFIKYIDFHRVILFLIPFSFLGLFWYIRNLILTEVRFIHKPFYFFMDLKIGILISAHQSSRQ